MTVKIDGTNTVANPAFTGADTDTGLQCGTNELKLVTGGTARATVDSSGKLGVATTSPQSKLSVGNAASTDDGLSITFTGDDTVVAKYFANTSSGEVTIGGVATNYFPTFYSSGSEAMRLDTSGNLGVGTASPNHRLTLHNPGTGTFDAFNITSGLTNSNGLQLGIDSASNVFFWHSANGAIKFATNNVERVRVTNNGLTFNGDTAAANALDDYEEGTFTPTPQFGGGSTGMTYQTAPTGHYTKIGNLVFVQLGFHFSNKGTSTGSFTIGGLPYSVANTGSFRHPNSVANAHNMNSTGLIFGALGTGSGIHYRKLNESQSDTVPGHGDFTNNTGFYHSLVYTT